MPRVECRTNDGFARDFDMTDGVEISVGRSPDNTLTEGGQALSRRHAVIHFIEGLTILKDLNSSNNTFLIQFGFSLAPTKVKGGGMRASLPKPSCEVLR